MQPSGCRRPRVFGSYRSKPSPIERSARALFRLPVMMVWLGGGKKCQLGILREYRGRQGSMSALFPPKRSAQKKGWLDCVVSHTHPRQCWLSICIAKGLRGAASPTRRPVHITHPIPKAAQRLENCMGWFFLSCPILRSFQPHGTGLERV